MNLPLFHDKVPSIVMEEPLARTLGVVANGLIEYRYDDAVRVAGHSCPTVAGTWLLLWRGLHALWPDQHPVRSGMTVHFPDPVEEGVTGVMASIATLVTGAAGAGGFKGLRGHWSRRDLLSFSDPCAEGATFALKRLDDGTGVRLTLNARAVPGDPDVGTLLEHVLSDPEDSAAASKLATMWQERVERMLVTERDTPGLVTVLAFE
ncbi:MAG: hypothetical protein KF813_12000 [Trueperaceae bacterium]|nr:hypothetical protein [Trueperaceae bacterium]